MAITTVDSSYKAHTNPILRIKTTCSLALNRSSAGTFIIQKLQQVSNATLASDTATSVKNTLPIKYVGSATSPDVLVTT